MLEREHNRDDPATYDLSALRLSATPSAHQSKRGAVTENLMQVTRDHSTCDRHRPPTRYRHKKFRQSGDCRSGANGV